MLQQRVVRQYANLIFYYCVADVFQQIAKFVGISGIFEEGLDFPLFGQLG